ncbi:hypothetical protein HBB16_03205 [Pseudonocardia sp. MCCB 268]|nr:hypothetical protein [Pseudonocardia cytotoxica]
MTAPIAVPHCWCRSLAVAILPTDPDNTVTTVLSFVPFFSQTLMPARAALGVAAGNGKVLVALVLALATLARMVLLSARVYRNSVLHRGGVPWREALSRP